MGRKRDSETTAVLRNLAVIFPIFYALSYVTASILVGAFELVFYGTLPFDFIVFGTANGRPLASLLCVVISFTLLGIILTAVVRSYECLWDYAITVAVVHILLSCVVMRDFPTNWRWWTCIISLVTAISILPFLLRWILSKVNAK